MQRKYPPVILNQYKKLKLYLVTLVLISKSARLLIVAKMMLWRRIIRQIGRLTVDLLERDDFDRIRQYRYTNNNSNLVYITECKAYILGFNFVVLHLNFVSVVYITSMCRIIKILCFALGLTLFAIKNTDTIGHLKITLNKLGSNVIIPTISILLIPIIGNGIQIKIFDFKVESISYGITIIILIIWISHWYWRFRGMVIFLLYIFHF